MKHLIGTVIIAGALSACQTSTTEMAPKAMAGKQLKTQSDMTAITGKKLNHEGNWVTFSDSGKMTGAWGGKPLAGTYEMRDGFFCRTLTEFVNGPVEEDCQLLILDGDQLNGTRKRGTGGSYVYQIS